MISFDHKGKTITYNIKKRICTLADLHYHFGNFDAKLSTFCFVKESKNGPISAFNGIDKSDLAVSNVCCCDEECLPLNYPCSKNEFCCTLNCVKNICTGFVIIK
ncbi:hypothetical protein MHBO_001097 [Bonamia ostreae]|uniref:WAP domain-containing protein n=1 Tax=Bonamia ostreae TaxID=126728 RepID=A0ABV2AIN5_9EUKA